METTKQTPLPPIQAMFMAHFDGTLASALRFHGLATVLNPNFSSMYGYVSGDRDSNTVTTKSTDGSFTYLDSHTDEMRENAFVLAREIRKFLMNHNPQPLSEIFKNNPESLRYFGKIDRAKKKMCFVIDDQIIVVPGLKL